MNIQQAQDNLANAESDDIRLYWETVIDSLTWRSEHNSKPRILHIRECRNCNDRFSTYERNAHYCDLCSHMESTQEWRERANDQITEQVLI